MAGRRLVSDDDAESMGFGGPDSARRRAVLRETLTALAEADPTDHYHQLAHTNLEFWAATAQPTRGLTIEVLPGDWGEVTATHTRRHGQCFAVLNMANAYVPGGAYGGCGGARREPLPSH